jgi:hypothetical protein
MDTELARKIEIVKDCLTPTFFFLPYPRKPAVCLDWSQFEVGMISYQASRPVLEHGQAYWNKKNNTDTAIQYK